MIQTILFDFNGVIIDDEPLQLIAMQTALGEENVALTEKEYYDSLGMDDATFVRASFARAGRPVSDEILRRVIEHKAKIHRESFGDELPLFPGVATFVKALSYQYRLGVVSMSRRTDIDYALKRANLDNFFNAIVSAEDVSACKPDPACYKRAFKILDNERYQRGLPPLTEEECLVIEDSPPGIQAARRVGMRTLGVTNTVPADALRAAGADVVTASLADWTTEAVQLVFDTTWGAHR